MTWRDLDRFVSPSGDELLLRERAGVYEIRCNGWDLMSSRAHWSEEELARRTLASVAARSPHILIGGLGMGFTLRAALGAAPAQARVTVAELYAEIVGWNRTLLASLAGRPLDDPRVAIYVGDVGALMQTNPGVFDAILLDVDNGPENAIGFECALRLYTVDAMRVARAALAPYGVLGVWSADRSAAFEAVLGAAGFVWRREDAPARGAPGDPLHSIYLARAA